jgi:hypothetical protein
MSDLDPHTPPEAPLLPEGASPQGYGLSLQPAGCPVCKKAHLVEPARIGSACPHCRRGKLKPQPARMRPEPPELILPFQKSPAELLPGLKTFVQSVQFRPDDLNPQILSRRAVPIYWPTWLIDAEVKGTWKAEMGFDYQVKSSQESYAAGAWRSNEVVETRVRWEARTGEIQRRYQNLPVPAIDNQPALTRDIGNYRSAPIPYTPEKVGRALLRIPDSPPEDVWDIAQGKLDSAAAEECRQAAEAHHVRQAVIHAAYINAQWTQLLQPLYATFYTTDDGLPHMLYINGQTGQIGGERFASQKKGWLWAGICLGLALLAFVATVVLAALSTVAPPAACFTMITLLAAVALVLAAVYCASWPWRWNRRQQELPGATSRRISQK